MKAWTLVGNSIFEARCTHETPGYLVGFVVVELERSSAEATHPIHTEQLHLLPRPRLTQSTDFMLLAGTHGTGEAKFVSAHALLEQCSLSVLDTHWPAQPGMLVWPKSTSGQVWMHSASSKQQIHDLHLHLVDQWLVRELPTNFIVLHTLKVFSCLGDLPTGRFLCL